MANPDRHASLREQLERLSGSFTLTTPQAFVVLGTNVVIAPRRPNRWALIMQATAQTVAVGATTGPGIGLYWRLYTGNDATVWLFKDLGGLVSEEISAIETIAGGAVVVQEILVG